MNKFVENLPKHFTNNVINLCGDKGENWLNNLPKTIQTLENIWSIKHENHFQNLSYNYVAKCKKNDGSQVVIKIALPLDNVEIFNEATALKLFDGKGSVKLLNENKELQAILIEHLSPGLTLKEVYKNDEFGAVDRAINVLQKIAFRPSKKINLPSTAKWFEIFETMENTEFPRKHLKKAQKHLKEIYNPIQNYFLLHGDFHHENILSSNRDDFLVIDPKGVIGSIGYEIAVFLNNHADWLESNSNYSTKMNYAIKKFSRAFGVSEQEINDWCYIQRVLSLCWSYEDNDNYWKKEIDSLFF